ncbi:MAG: hypothetical protein HY965_07070 [Ignavibacteriales bacterium]|nr:hypothetical protein [Ignavibacteriales bacterium]
MKIEKSWILVFFYALILLGCRDKQLAEGQEELILEGVWTESFIHREFKVYLGADTPPDNISKYSTEISEITFANGRYTIRFPGHIDRNPQYYPDPMTKGQTGTYKVKDGKLILTEKENTTEEQFTMSLTHQSMELVTCSYTDKYGEIIGPRWSVLWGYTYYKFSGEFTKKPLQ